MVATLKSEKEKLKEFEERIHEGDKIEANNWMPDEYRMALIKLISMHGISSLQLPQ